jgi:hypothetical protein
MTVAKTICGVIAVVLFGMKAIGVGLGSIDLTAAGLFFLGIAILPI